MAHCIGLDMRDPVEAWKHIYEDQERVVDYGDNAYGHPLYSWDNGGRALLYCKVCGGYVLLQKSVYYGYDNDDRYCRDYFPVESPQEADELNRKYNGINIELNYPDRYLIRTNTKIYWSKKKEKKKEKD